MTDRIHARHQATDRLPWIEGQMTRAIALHGVRAGLCCYQYPRDDVRHRRSLRCYALNMVYSQAGVVTLQEQHNALALGTSVSAAPAGSTSFEVRHRPASARDKMRKRAREDLALSLVPGSYIYTHTNSGDGALLDRQQNMIERHRR